MGKLKVIWAKVKKRAVPALVGSSVVLSVAVPSFAAGTEVADAVTSGTTLFSSTVALLTGNPILLAILGAALIPLGFRIFKAAKRAVK